MVWQNTSEQAWLGTTALQSVCLSPTVPSVLDIKSCSCVPLPATPHVLSALTGIGLAPSTGNVHQLHLDLKSSSSSVFQLSV